MSIHFSFFNLGTRTLTASLPGEPTISPINNIFIFILCNEVGARSPRPLSSLGRGFPAPTIDYRPSTIDPLLFRVLNGPHFPDHRNLDLPGILHTLLNLLADIPGQDYRVIVGNPLRLDNNPDLPAGLDGVRLLHPFKRIGNGLQLSQFLD